MNVKQIYQLEQGHKVNHEQFGTCTVDGIIRGQGPLLIPDTIAGRARQSEVSRTPVGTPVVETSFHMLTSLTPFPSESKTGSFIPSPLTGTLPRF